MNYIVYCYVFDDGMTYIGLTRRRPELRDRIHRNGTRHGKYTSSVKRYYDQSGFPFPDMYVLERGMTKTEAQKTEDMYAMAVPPEYRLNRAKTGIGISSVGFPEDGKTLTTEEKILHARESRRKYYKTHKLQSRKRNTKYRSSESYREKQKVYKKAYRASHKAERAAYMKKYYQRNRKRMIEMNSIWQREHRKKKVLM